MAEGKKIHQCYTTFATVKPSEKAEHMENKLNTNKSGKTQPSQNLLTPAINTYANVTQKNSTSRRNAATRHQQRLIRCQ
eukprot:5116215-Ditylum_brightwellii.AAC.1